MLLTLPDIPLRTASFALEDRCLVWSKAQLYSDRLVLSGWGFCERYWRRVPLDAITRIEREGRLVTLEMETEETLVIRLQKAEQWAVALEMHRDVYERGN